MRQATLLRLLGGALGLFTVAPLLAWLWGFGSFSAWYAGMLPIVVLGLAGIGVLSAREPQFGDVRAALVSGFFGGLLATVGYDLVRVPFVVFGGVQLFAPIQSFGILALNAHGSSPATDWAGWSDHFLNGIGFGMAFAMVALGRRWAWGILWGCTLETLTLLTPYAREYAIAGHWDLIALALGAHLVYGSLLGVVVQHGRAFTSNADHISRRTALVCVFGLVAVLAVWIRPDRAVDDPRTAADHAAGVGIVLDGAAFRPQWTRLAPGACVAVSNHDSQAHQLTGGTVIGAHDIKPICAPSSGADRVRVDGKPFSGGFLLADPYAR